MAVEAGSEGTAAGAGRVPPQNATVGDFARQRDGFAAGEGVPAGLAHSPGASRQWVSDELSRTADKLALRRRGEGEAWLRSLWRRSLYAVGGTLAFILALQGLTAIAAGWSDARTAALLAAVALAGLLVGAAWLHRAQGGLVAPLIGDDGRLSTTRAVAGAWALFVAYALLHLALVLALADGAPDLDNLDAGGSGGLVTAVAAVWACALGARAVVAYRQRTGSLGKVRAERPRTADLLTDDAGRAALVDVQYAGVSAFALVFAAVVLARRPEELPGLPWGVAALVAVSAAAQLAAKLADGGRPVVLSVVRVREAGDLHTPIRTGDDIEVRGAGFVPPGAAGAEMLARVVVRIGGVHVHVPLVPVPGGFANPADTTLTVPVPVEVGPGRAELRVVTAAGAESAPYLVDIVD